MQSKLPQVVSTLKLGGKEMKIYRSVEDPLFDCTEINVHILEYKKSSYFNWYKNNKENVNYGVLIYLQQNEKRFYTEIGLYQAFFASDLKFAEKFKFELIIMLKNLRLGNLELYIKKECEFTKLIGEKDSLLMEFSLKNQNLEEKLKSLEVKVSQYNLHFSKDGIQSNYVYKGHTNKPKRRFGEHRRNSCNKDVKRLLSEGYDMKMVITGEIIDYRGKEAIKKEQEAISNSEGMILLNIQKNLTKHLQSPIKQFNLNNVKQTKIEKEEEKCQLKRQNSLLSMIPEQNQQLDFSNVQKTYTKIDKRIRHLISEIQFVNYLQCGICQTNDKDKEMQNLGRHSSTAGHKQAVEYVLENDIQFILYVYRCELCNIQDIEQNVHENESLTHQKNIGTYKEPEKIFKCPICENSNATKDKDHRLRCKEHLKRMQDPIQAKIFNDYMKEFKKK